MDKSLFSVGHTYTREDVYEALSVPEARQRGNWETGYNSYGGDLYIFCNVGASGRSGHDYDNRWLDDARFQWFAKERTHVGQKQIKWMLNPTGNILLFTRDDNRQPFAFNGFCEPTEHEETTPVKIVWRVHQSPTVLGPDNLALANRTALEEQYYIRKADPKGAYWFDFNKGRVDQYRTKWQDDFFLVIAGDECIAGDYYCMPYAAVAHMLSNSCALEDDRGRARWVGDVRQHRLRVSHCPIRLDIGQYYGIPLVASEQSKDTAEEHDYAIENRLAEINQRQKQSVFRKRVLDNFGGRCCISGVTELDLLVASHIVPWAQRVDSRLDPANGLCLLTLYDALFDRGYFTLTDELTVLASHSDEQSPELRKLLNEINGNRIAAPAKTRINPEYLAYHREHLFGGFQ